MYKSGAFVAEHVTPVTDEQVQPNGVDLTLEAVFEQREPGRIGIEGKEVGVRHRRREHVVEGFGENDATDPYYLPPGGYVARYTEIVRIPEGHVGFIYPRSSLLRNSCMLNTAVWDAGYEGRGEGLLQVHHDIEIERGARVAQLVLCEADHDDVYDGSYQGENVE
ncbi:deoxyuridine 5'-triphosphate nucleotidohydrolase [Halococcus hamelinensis]|uniref:Deoxyuridine 5'-triphosphate nucleotidohydrolase n=1 Tax=Halococcus hamelinensis 100A6 TaxID=1132509 RepID=M0M6X3_9EURY|nr:deoxyuridine 5'-triphosphate nucleotidohydrolase [Halococcus hamelinensis]EMA41461.1 deoxyuridine 5'-triphosphate nucleotidohydrolase [Halococcus hamelinensis 100A6]